MSTKRRNRSRWDSSRSSLASLCAPGAAAPGAPTSAAASTVAAPVPAADMAPASPTPATETRSHNVSLQPPVSNFVLDYRYELSLPAQMLASRLERQPWLDPVSEYSKAYSSRDPEGYELDQGRHYGRFHGDGLSPLEDYPSMPQRSEGLQHYPGTLRNERSQLLGQFGSGMASEAPPYLDPVRERWHAAELIGQNSNFYGLPSGRADVGYGLQPALTSEFSSERGIGRRDIDATIIDSQAGGTLLAAGQNDVLSDVKSQGSLERLPIGGNQNEPEEGQPNETQKSNAESSDGKEACAILEPPESEKGGLSASMGVHSRDGEQLARKSRDYKNYRFPGRYAPY